MKETFTLWLEIIDKQSQSFLHLLMLNEAYFHIDGYNNRIPELRILGFIIIGFIFAIIKLI